MENEQPPHKHEAASDETPGPRYVARITTLFQFPDRDIQLIAGTPVSGLTDSQRELLLILNFVERQ